MMAAAVTPDPATAPDDGQPRQHARLAAALFGFVAIVQLLGMASRGVRQLFSPYGIAAAFPHLAIVLPAAGFAFGLWRGRRLRIATIAFALLWSVVSIWAARSLQVVVAAMAARPPPIAFAVTPLSRWFVPLVAARGICFAAATIVLVTGRPTRTRRTAGAALALLFALLFAAEHLYLNVPALRG
jgi:hypothetical protein